MTAYQVFNVNMGSDLKRENAVTEASWIAAKATVQAKNFMLSRQRRVKRKVEISPDSRA